MKNKTYILNSTYACPVCHGILKRAKSDMVILRCNDCNSFFKAVDTFESTDALKYEKVDIGN